MVRPGRQTRAILRVRSSLLVQARRQSHGRLVPCRRQHVVPCHRVTASTRAAIPARSFLASMARRSNCRCNDRGARPAQAPPHGSGSSSSIYRGSTVVAVSRACGLQYSCNMMPDESGCWRRTPSASVLCEIFVPGGRPPSNVSFHLGKNVCACMSHHVPL